MADDNVKDRIKAAGLVVGGLTAVSYALLWLVYLQFYSQFRIRPEDVGLEQAQFVYQALVGPVVVIACAALLITAALGTAVAWGLLQDGIFKDLHRLTGAARSDQRRNELARELRRRGADVRVCTRERVLRHWRGYVASSLVLATGIVLLVMVLYARAAAVDVRQEGVALSSVSLDIAGVSLPLLHFQALQVELHTDDPVVTGIPGVHECALWLGRADGRLVVFNVREQRTYLVPAEGVAVQLREEDLPPDCLPATQPAAATTTEAGEADRRTDPIPEEGLP